MNMKKFDFYTHEYTILVINIFLALVFLEQSPKTLVAYRPMVDYRPMVGAFYFSTSSIMMPITVNRNDKL